MCDRFYDSTYAYQAAGRALEQQTIRSGNALGSCGVDPDRTLVLDMETDAALARATRDGADRMEAEGVAFQRRVREGYLRLVAEEPERVRRVDAGGSVEDVSARLDAALADLLPVLAGEGR